MLSYINKNFDAKVAPARINVTESGVKRDGFDAACMRSIQTLRHLVRMLRHHSTQCHIGGSAPLSSQLGINPSGGAQEPSNYQGYQPEYRASSRIGEWSKTMTWCLTQTLKRLKSAQIAAPTLVTT